MEAKNRTVFVVLIAVVIVAAVFSSFGLNLFTPETAKVELPQLTEEPGNEPGDDVTPGTEEYLRVDITPETVQNVIRTMIPLQPESYYRTVTVQTALGNGQMGVTTSRVWVDRDWTKVESTWPNGIVESTLIGGGRVYHYFGGGDTWNEWEEGERDANLAQRLPTYEDVLALPTKLITSTGYEAHEGISCIYVEAAENEVGNRERYWISVTEGLLVAAETWQGEELVLSMSAAQAEMPVPPGVRFELPDGTVLHTPAS